MGEKKFKYFLLQDLDVQRLYYRIEGLAVKCLHIRKKNLDKSIICDKYAFQFSIWKFQYNKMDSEMVR